MKNDTVDSQGAPDEPETAQDRIAREEELAQLTWMDDPAVVLARRIPTSVFALGDLASR